MRRKIRASCTIEASILFPFLLAVIVLIIYESFYIHDRTVLAVASNEAALRGSRITDPNCDISEKVRETGERETEGRLLSTKNLTMDVTVNSKEVKVTFTGDFGIPGGVIFAPGMGLGTDEIRVSAHSSRTDPVRFIRGCRLVAGGRRGNGG